MSDYWPALQIYLAAFIVLLGLRFAFPQLRTAIGLAYLSLLATVAVLPGAPAWLRVGAVAVAVVAGVLLVRSRAKGPRSS